MPLSPEELLRAVELCNQVNDINLMDSEFDAAIFELSNLIAGEPERVDQVNEATKEVK